MNRAPLAIIALVIGVAACQEMTTAPASSPDLRVQSARFSNPPPPPIDTGAGVGVSFEAATTRLVDPFSIRSSILDNGVRGGSSSVNASATQFLFFVIPVTYLFNPNGSSGYLHFHDDANNDIDSDANGTVKFQKGDFDGKGKVTIQTSFGPIVINLASVNDGASTFEGCSENIPSVAAAARPDSFCFQVTFDDVTVNGVPAGPVTMSPSCYARPENNFCDNEEVL